MTDGTRVGRTSVSVTVGPDESGSIAIASNPPDGQLDVPYSAQLEVHRWRVQGGLTWSGSGLPDGLRVTSGGLITGTPTATGTFDVTLNVSGNTAYASAVVRIVITRSPTPIVLDTSLPGAQVGTDYAYALRVVGGAPLPTPGRTPAAPCLPD